MRSLRTTKLQDKLAKTAKKKQKELTGEQQELVCVIPAITKKSSGWVRKFYNLKNSKNPVDIHTHKDIQQQDKKEETNKKNDNPKGVGDV